MLIRRRTGQGATLIALTLALTLARTGHAFLWSDRAALPTVDGAGRGLHGGGTIANQIYLAGGGFSGALLTRSYRSAVLYDPPTDSWSVLPDMAERRMNPAAAVANRMGEPQLFVFGGADISTPGVVINHTSGERFDPVAIEWQPLPDPLPGGGETYGICAVTVDNVIYLMGGADFKTRTLSNRLLAFDPDSGSFQALAAMPQPVSDGACVAIGRKIYWIGGFAGSANTPPITSTYVYDIDASSWSTRASAAPTARADAAAATSGTMIWVFGGWTETFRSFNTVDQYDTTADTWVGNLPDPLGCVRDNGSRRGRAGLSLHPVAGPSGGQLYAVGGSLEIGTPTTCNESTPAPISPGCTTGPYNLDVTSLRAVRASGCAPGQVQVSWRVRNPVLTADRYSLHELGARDSLVADRLASGTPPGYREPFASPPLLPLVSAPSTCAAPTLSGPGVVFFALWQADECTGLSVADLP